VLGVKNNQHVCVDAATTSHFCGDVLPSFLEGGDAGIGPVDFFTLHLFVRDVHFAIQHIDFFDIVIFPGQFFPGNCSPASSVADIFSRARAAVLGVKKQSTCVC